MKNPQNNSPSEKNSSKPPDQCTVAITVASNAQVKIEDFAPKDLEQKYYQTYIKRQHGTNKYLVDGVIDQGGTGEILDAEDQDLQRQVAMKVLLSEKKEDVYALNDFIAEAKITGYLEHPNIVPIHEVGLCPFLGIFFTMKRINGETLNKILHCINNDDPEYVEKYSVYRLLNIFNKICDAVSYAHSMNVIHLDIKPENIMVGEYGEVYLMDWGSAKVVGDPQQESDLTKRRFFTLLEHLGKTGDEFLTGTPSFSSPEQLISKACVDQRTDIFLLGATLYKIFTLHSPYSGETPEETREKAINRDLIPPHIRNPQRQIPSAISRIILKAMAKEIDSRYQSVYELKKDLEKYTQYHHSITLSEKSNGILSNCHKIISRAKREKRKINKSEYNKLYEGLGNAINGFEQSLELWDKNHKALQGKNKTHIIYAKLAIENKDINSAEYHTEKIDNIYLQKKQLQEGIKVTKKKKVFTKISLLAFFLITMFIISVNVTMLLHRNQKLRQFSERSSQTIYKIIGSLDERNSLQKTHLIIDILKKEITLLKKEGLDKDLDQVYLQAMNDIGEMYEYGEGVEKSSHEALEWYQRSSEYGSLQGTYNLAKMYQYSQNSQENVVWNRFHSGWQQLNPHNISPDVMEKIGNCYQHGLGVPKNITEALSWYQKAIEKYQQQNAVNYVVQLSQDSQDVVTFRQAVDWYKMVAKANRGNSDKMYALGDFYETRTDIPQNFTEAFAWYEKAALKNHEQALKKVFYLLKDQAISLEKNKIFEWYQRFAEKKYGPLSENDYLYAVFSLAKLYENGEGTSQDLAKAFYWYQQAARQDHPEALVKLAFFCKEHKFDIDKEMMYKIGKLYGKRNEYQEAHYWFFEAAKRKHAGAMYNLSWLYENGLGVEQSYAKTFYWCQQCFALDPNETYAAYNMGWLYENGYGIEKNHEKAFDLYRQAAERDNPHAIYKLGYFYERGLGCEKSFQNAYYWYKKSAEKGNTESMYKVGLFYEMQKKYELAFEWFTKAGLDQAEAMYKVGVFYENGHGTTQNDKLAQKWYKKAAEKGDIEAMYIIAVQYEKEAETENKTENTEEAKKWYKKAAEKGHPKAASKIKQWEK